MVSGMWELKITCNLKPDTWGLPWFSYWHQKSCTLSYRNIIILRDFKRQHSIQHFVAHFTFFFFPRLLLQLPLLVSWLYIFGFFRVAQTIFLNKVKKKIKKPAFLPLHVMMIIIVSKMMKMMVMMMMMMTVLHFPIIIIFFLYFIFLNHVFDLIWYRIFLKWIFFSSMPCQRVVFLLDNWQQKIDAFFCFCFKNTCTCCLRFKMCINNHWNNIFIFFMILILFHSHTI